MEYNQQNIDQTSSNSDMDENETSSDHLNESINIEQEDSISKTDYQNSTQSEDYSLNETIGTIEPKKYQKEIEWWNEITPWKNGENFYAKLTEVSMGYSNQSNNIDEYSNNSIKEKRKKKLDRSITCRTYCDQCPLTFDGAFGLIQAYHKHQLCLPSKNLNKKICLYQHFHSKHGFTSEVSARLVRAIIHQQDPYETKLFSSNSDTPLTLHDPYHKVKCPLSNRYDIINTPCLTQEITRKSIRRHLFGVHRLDPQTIDKLIKQMIK